jgi:predicted thioredoxin/glutaredoxin
MKRNKLVDVRDHAFEWLERLKDDDITREDIDKAKVVANLCKVIVDSSKVEVMQMQLIRKTYDKVVPISDFFEITEAKIQQLDQSKS